jgi:hypothetical protein
MLKQIIMNTQTGSNLLKSISINAYAVQAYSKVILQASKPPASHQQAISKPPDRKYKETQRNTRKHKETYANTKKHKETCGNTNKETQRNIM